MSFSNPASSPTEDMEQSNTVEAAAHIDCSDVEKEPEYCADNEYQEDPFAIKEEPDEVVNNTVMIRQ